MRTYQRNRCCLVFSQATGAAAEFKKMQVVEYSDATSFRMYARIPNTSRTLVPAEPSKWQEAIVEASQHIILVDKHFVGAAELKDMPVWEDMNDSDRVLQHAQVPVLLKAQKEKALEALAASGNVMGLRRA